MSLVTNIVFAFSIIEENDPGDEDKYLLVEKINQWLSERGYGEFGDADQSNRGFKALEIPTYVGAFNFLMLDEFLEFIKALPWKEPENVQIFIKEQGDEKYRLLEPFLQNKEVQ